MRRSEKIMRRLVAPLLFVPALAAAAAAPEVRLDSKVLAEVVTEGADGRRTILAAPDKVVPGDALVFQTSFSNAGSAPATQVVVTNPVPAGVAYAGDGGPDAKLSVDGGRSFGDLPALKVRDADGSMRPARPADVTTVRWTVPRIAPGAAGVLRYRGVVR